MTKFYVDAAGNYVGAYDGAIPPSGSVEVAIPPNLGTDSWDGTKWVASQAVVQEIQRLLAIAAAQSNAGLKSVNIDQANAFIDDHMDAITSLATAKEEIRTILKKMIPYLLK